MTVLPWLVGAGLLLGCSSPTEPARAQFMVFGTQVEVLIRSSDRPRVEAALRELGEDFQRMHSDWHPWEPGALSDLNAALAAGVQASPGPDLLAMIRDAQRFEQASLGHFNAAIGGLIALWGFHTSSYPIHSPPPDQAQIDQWLDQSPSTLDIDIRDHRVDSGNPAVRLDFSGLAKGHAADRACGRLVALGLGDALINLGGDVMICGAGEQSWSIAISDGRGGVFEVIELSGPVGVFSSGTAQRWGEWQDGRYAHLLNPSTGRALDHFVQATVIHRDPALADAAATALAVAGPSDWRSVAESMGVTQVLVLGASGPVGISAAMADRFNASTDS